MGGNGEKGESGEAGNPGPSGEPGGGVSIPFESNTEHLHVFHSINDN